MGVGEIVVGGTFAVQQLAVVCHTLFKATGVPNNSSQSVVPGLGAPSKHNNMASPELQITRFLVCGDVTWPL